MTDALFQSQSAPYADFKAPGQHYEGTVVGTGQVQSRKFVPPNQRAAGKQGDLEFWPDGKPKMTAIITLQTTLRDPNIPGDDGQRSLWIKGKSMTNSVKDAIRQAGAARSGIVVGGYLAMTYTHSDPEPEFEGGTPTKHYAVEYRQPAPGAQPPQDNINIVGGAPAPAQGYQAPQQAYSGQAAPMSQGASQPGAQYQQAPYQVPQQVPQGNAYAAPAQPQVQEAQVVQQPAAAPAAGTIPPGFDTSGMSPEAVAALQAMFAAQQGGGQ